jgi:hypothetical protein
MSNSKSFPAFQPNLSPVQPLDLRTRSRSHQPPAQLIKKRARSTDSTPEAAGQPAQRWTPPLSTGPAAPLPPRTSSGDVDWEQLTWMVYTSATPILVRNSFTTADELPSNFQRLGDLLLVYPTETERRNCPIQDYAGLLKGFLN